MLLILGNMRESGSLMSHQGQADVGWTDFVFAGG